MTLYILDTDICSYIIRKHSIEVLETLQQKSEQGYSICISSITYAELLVGAERSAAIKKHRMLINAFVERVDRILSWDEKAAEQFALTQAELYGNGTPIGQNDTLIAAHVISISGVLITNNNKHFSKVSGLVLENWL